MLERPRMPLPRDVSDDPDPMIGEDEYGNMMVLTRDGAAATFTEGRWQPGLLFPVALPDDRRDEFNAVTDEQKREAILAAAADALRESRRRESPAT
jgi:hypothetical protein